MIMDKNAALNLLRPLVPFPTVETVTLEQALGRILAAMDGFAVNTRDLVTATQHTPVILDVIGEAVPGHPFAGEVRPGQAAAIATGAPVPAGADAVVPWEAGVLAMLGRSLLAKSTT